MVYGFVTQSKGRIEIESEVGRGTTVKLYLPRSREARREQSVGPVEVVATGQERVLLVEDDDLLRVQVGGELENLGYRVVSARSGLEALRLLQDGEQFDLLGVSSDRRRGPPEGDDHQLLEAHQGRAIPERSPATTV